MKILSALLVISTCALCEIKKNGAYFQAAQIYRVFLNGFIIFQGVIEGPQTNKKLYGRGGSKMQPWGDMGKILVFGLSFQKKS